MTDIARLMRLNLELCERQMLDMADKAKSTVDQAAFVRGAAIYRKIIDSLPGSGL
jgi:hypothetical protein